MTRPPEPWTEAALQQAAEQMIEAAAAALLWAEQTATGCWRMWRPRTRR